MDNFAFKALITLEEVVKLMMAMANNLSPGQDKLTLKDLCHMDPEGDALAELFNLWLIIAVSWTDLRSVGPC